MDSFIDIAQRENRRLLYLAGMTSDVYCTSAALFHSLESLLVLLLRERGYRRIVFYSASRKLHWMDAETAKWCTPSGQRSSNLLPTGSDPALRPGPLGTHRLRRPETATPTWPAVPPAADTPRWHFGAMTDGEVVRTLQTWLSDRDVLTALVVRDAEDLITYFKGDEQRFMNELFGVLQQPDSQTGLCILLFRGHISAKMFESGGKGWSNLFEKMLDENQNLSSAVFFVGPPDETEIAHALTAERLQTAVFNPGELRERAARLARQARFAYAENKNTGSLGWLLGPQLKATDRQQGSAWQRLQAITGMGGVIEQLRGMILAAQDKRRWLASQASLASQLSGSGENAQRMLVSRLAAKPRRSERENTLHLALLGSPGTGKTTVARMIAEIYREEGLLEIGHLVEATRKDLVAGYVGQTAINTGAIIERAMGGVLFIDEAYQLVEKGDQHNWGKEAIETIMKAMSDHNGHFAVIIAGYPDGIREFINTNVGLHGRFPQHNWLTFDDYAIEHLQGIFIEAAADIGLTVDAELQQLLPEFLARWKETINPETFQNARQMLLLVEEMDRARVKREGLGGPRILTCADVPTHLRIYLPVA